MRRFGSLAATLLLCGLALAPAHAHSNLPLGRYDLAKQCRDGQCSPVTGGGYIRIQAGTRYELSTPTRDGSGGYHHPANDSALHWTSGPLASSSADWSHGTTAAGRAKIVERTDTTKKVWIRR